MRLLLPLSTALFCVLLATSPPSRAGGLYVSEFATGDMGAAGSGILAGGASDSSSSVANPATMTLVDSHQLQLGLAPGLSNIEFDTAPDTPVSGGDGNDQGGLVPLLSSSYVHRLSDRIRIGLGLVSISGAGLDPDNSWAGRNQVTEITLISLTAVPQVAVRITDWLSIGGGPAITYATLDWKLRVPLPGPPGNEGPFKFDGIDDVDVAATVGVLLTPFENLRIGFVYQSETELELSGNVDVPVGANPVDVKLELPLAEAFRVDAVWHVTDDVAFSMGGAHENWSALSTTDINLGPAESSVRLGFRDTWKLRAGVHVDLTDRWLVQTGVSYDSSALRKRDRTPALPIDEQWRIGVGAVYKWTEDKVVSFSFQYTDLGDSAIDNAALKGDYTNNEIYFFQMGIKFKHLPWAGRLSF